MNIIKRVYSQDEFEKYINSLSVKGVKFSKIKLNYKKLIPIFKKWNIIIKDVTPKARLTICVVNDKDIKIIPLISKRYLEKRVGGKFLVEETGFYSTKFDL